MRSLKEIGKNLCKRALSLTVSAALVCASIPLARMSSVHAVASPNLQYFATKSDWAQADLTDDSKSIKINLGSVPEAIEGANTQPTALGLKVGDPLTWWVVGANRSEANLYSEKALFAGYYFRIDPSNPNYYSNDWGCNYSDNVELEQVNYAHYGGSIIRNGILKTLDSTLFNPVENSLVAPSTINCWDMNNSKTYTVLDKLYLPSAGSELERATSSGNKIYVPDSVSDINNCIPKEKWVSNLELLASKNTWSRSEDGFSNVIVTGVDGSLTTNMYGEECPTIGASPACKINLSSLIFSSAAPKASEATSSAVLSDRAQNLRLQEGTDITETVSRNTSYTKITTKDAPTNGTYYLMVQGVADDGTNYAYSKEISGGIASIQTSEVSVATVSSFEGAKVWIEKASVADNGQLLYSSEPVTISVDTNCEAPEEEPTYGGNPADFVFIVPTDEELIYDGTAKDAKVSAVPEELQDKITVKYYNSEGMIVDKAVDAGVYTVKIDVAATTNYGEVKNLTHPDWTFTIRKRDLNKNYFTFSAPSNAEYNGSPKNASVKLAENYRGVGAVTVKYYNAEGNEVEPINAGEYTVKIDVSTGANYNQAADLTADDWKFTIEKGTPCYTAPTGLAAKSGQKLSEIAFPESSVGTWQWADAQGEGETTTAPENTVISSAGTYKANFVPNDQDNYNTVENIDIFVTTGSMSEDVSGKVDAKLSENTYTYDGNEWKPTVTVKYYKDGVPTVTTDGTGGEENDATGETENSGTETTADEGVELIPGTDYTVTYPSDMTSVGTKPIIVNYKGAYSGYSFLTGEIKYLELGVGADGRPINPYIANGDNVYNDGETIWKIENGDVIITPPDGYTISDDFNSETYGDTLTITGEASAGSTIIYLKDADGHVTAGIPISEAVKNDMEGPKGVISINVSEGIDAMFRNFMNKVTFGLMFSDDRTATIAAKDSSSGVKSIEYIVAHKDLFPNDKENQTTTPEAPEAGTESGETPEAGTAGGETPEAGTENGETPEAGTEGGETPEQTPVETVKGYTLQEIEDTLTAGGRVWQEYTGPIALERNNKYVVYAKLTDNVGNVTYINSSGVTIYATPILSRYSIKYTKNSTEGQSIDVTPNNRYLSVLASIVKVDDDYEKVDGEEIIELEDGKYKAVPLNDTDYTSDIPVITPENFTMVEQGTITFNASYLNSFDVGNHTLLAGFFDGKRETIPVKINLKVAGMPLASEQFKFTAPTDTAYNGQAKTATVTPVESINEGEIGKITLRYFEVVTKEGEPAEGTEGSLTELKELSGEPVIPGTYRVKIDVTAGTVYSSANELEPSTGSWNFTIAKSTANAELFEFHAPENLVYDTHEKTATVTPKDGVTGIGEITVKYYKVITAENGTKTYELLDSENPTSAGTYAVKIDVAAGEYYGGETGIEPGEGGWSFTIAKAYPSARDFNYTDPQSFTGK